MRGSALLASALTMLSSAATSATAPLALRLQYPLPARHIITDPVSASPGLILLEQDVRPAAGATLLDEVTDARVRVPAGTELYAAQLGDVRLYCTFKLFPNNNLFGREGACFADLDQNGQFDRILAGGGSFSGVVPSQFPMHAVAPITPVRFVRGDEAGQPLTTVVAELRAVDLERRRSTVCIHIGKPSRRCSQSVEVKLTSLPVDINVAGIHLAFSGSSDRPLVRVVSALPEKGIVLEESYSFSVR